MLTWIFESISHSVVFYMIECNILSENNLMFQCMLLVNYHFLHPNLIAMKSYSFEWYQIQVNHRLISLIDNILIHNVDRKVIHSSNLWVLLNHPSISVHILHILIKQRKKKNIIYEYIKKKVILLILARYVIPRVIWQIGSTSVYSTTHVFSMSLEPLLELNDSC